MWVFKNNREVFSLIYLFSEFLKDMQNYHDMMTASFNLSFY